MLETCAGLKFIFMKYKIFDHCEGLPPRCIGNCNFIRIVDGFVYCFETEREEATIVLNAASFSYAIPNNTESI